LCWREVKALEEDLGALFDTKHAIGCASGSTRCSSALMAL